MNWEEAKTGTITQWEAIRDSIGVSDEVTLLTDINAVSDLCQLAKGEAVQHDDLVKCHFCPAYEQFGGCKQVCGELSDLAVRKDFDAMRDMIQSFIDRLQTLDPPPEPHAH